MHFYFIVKSRQPDASEEVANTGIEKLEELNQLTSQFILRSK